MTQSRGKLQAVLKIWRLLMNIISHLVKNNTLYYTYSIFYED
jgi:hypothetical protein